MTCVNTTDPITMETLDEIPQQNIIKLNVNNKLRFYNVKSLYVWIQKSQTDPETRTVFSKSQIKKINIVYAKSKLNNKTSAFLNTIQTFNTSVKDERKINDVLETQISRLKDIDVDIKKIQDIFSDPVLASQAEEKIMNTLTGCFTSDITDAVKDVIKLIINTDSDTLYSFLDSFKQ